MEPYIITGFCLCLFASIIGVPTNVIILYIYSKKKKKSSSHCFIIGHAIVDLVIASVVLPIGAVQYLTLESFRSVFLCKMVTWLTLAAPLASLNVNTVVAFDRFFAVTRPHSRFVSGKKVSAILVTVVILLAFLINVPHLFWWRIREVASPGEPSCYLSVHGITRILALLPFSFVYVILILINLILYVIIYYKVRKLRRNRVVAIHLTDSTSTPRGNISTGVVVNTTITQLPPPSATSVSQSPRALHPVGLTHANGINASQHNSSVHNNQNVTNSRNALVENSARNNGVGQSQAMVNATFRMLFYISAIFITTWFLQTTLRFIPRQTTESWRMERPGLYAVYTFFQYIIVMNSCVNLFVYAIVNKEFRNELRTLRNDIMMKLRGLFRR